MMKLAALQSWMQDRVMEPDDATTEAPSTDTVLLGSQRQTADERLAVYQQAYLARLYECLADEFPTVAWMVGSETYQSFCQEYLAAHPSRHYSLDALGAEFPAYLRQTRPADAARPSWADLLIDVATLERTYAEVFDGPGIENYIDSTLPFASSESTEANGVLVPPLGIDLPNEFGNRSTSARRGVRHRRIQNWRSTAMIANDSPVPPILNSAVPDPRSAQIRMTDQFPDAVLDTLQFAPCLRLLELQFPAHEYVSAVRRVRTLETSSEAVPMPLPEPTFLVVTRRDYIVRRVAIMALEYRMLEALLAGQSLHSAFAAAESHCGTTLSPDFVAACFQHWQESKWLLGVRA